MFIRYSRPSLSPITKVDALTMNIVEAIVKFYYFYGVIEITSLVLIRLVSTHFRQ